MADLRSRLWLLALVVALAAVLGFWTFSAADAVLAFRKTGYLLTLVAFAALVFHLYRLVGWREVYGRFRDSGWRICVFVVLLSCFLHQQDRHGFKVVMDEVDLISTSKRLHETREAAMVGRGYYLSGDNFVVMQGDVDKRPLFYPFLLSLVHDITGYRPENTFVLNALLTPVLLLLMYGVGRHLAGSGAGVAAVLLLSTMPLIVQAVTGGGFEVLNLVMIMLTMLLGMSYAQRPSSDVLTAFCLSGVLLAQVRYESVIFVAPVGIVVLWVWWRDRRIDLPWGVIFCPLLLVGYPWQYRLMELRPHLWQMTDRPSEHGVFSIYYFYENIGRALNYFLSFDNTHANSHLVFVAGVVGGGFFWLILYRNYRVIFRDRPQQAVFIVFSLSLFALSFFLLCYFWGAFDDIVTVRLSLPMQILMIWMFIYVWPELAGAAARWSVVSAICIVYIFVWTVPTAGKRAYAFENLAAEGANWIRSYIRDHRPQKSLVLDSHTLLVWVAYGVPATTLDGVASRREEFLFHYRRHTFENYLVVQRMAPTYHADGGWRPVDFQENLAAALTLEPVDQIVFTPVYALRISRIVAVDETALKSWSERRMENRKTTTSTAQDAFQSSAALENARYVEEWIRNLP